MVIKSMSVVALTVVLAACASLPETVEEPGEYVWPSAPEKPKIQYIKSLWGRDDVAKSTPLKRLLGDSSFIDLFKPYGVTVDKQGRIYVPDTVRKAIFIIDELNEKLTFIGTRNHLLRVPVGVAVDDRERVFVSDTGHDEVFVFDNTGRFIRRFGKGFLENPSGLAIESSDQRIYVVSTKSHRIEVFSLDGEYLFGFGGRGNAPGLMNYPRDIAFSPLGEVHVVDSGNFRIQVFSRTGTYVREFGSLGKNPGQFSRPKGIGIDTEGNLYVTDAAFNNFQVFDPQGSLLLFVGSGGMLGPGEFSLPADISVDIQGRIYVVDQLNRRLQIFQKLQ
jgi:DNA-binding beta-propeller fold protein YncE